MSGKAYIQKSILASLLDEGTATRPQLAELIGCETSSMDMMDNQDLMNYPQTLVQLMHAK